MENEPLYTLKKYWGYDNFRNSQEAVIKSVLEGNDTLALLPTGGGKSITFQVPAMMRKGICIVVSPLIALMTDQVEALKNREIRALSLAGGLPYPELERLLNNALYGQYKFLYLSPERLQQEVVRNYLKVLPINLIVIDEAHCVSLWGKDFRPAYLQCKWLKEQFPNIPLLALTASATPQVQQDILHQLGIEKANVISTSLARPNIAYKVYKVKSKFHHLLQLLRTTEGTVIIYLRSRNGCVQLAHLLESHDISATYFHGGLPAEEKNNKLSMWLLNDVRVMVATNAFGMGIDKPDVRFVIHYDIPKSIESYYQETGRAGRDGGEGYCLAFYCYKDIEKLEKFMVSKPIAEQEVGQALLQDMVAYAETSSSRRKFILHYFGEEFDEINGEGANMDDNMRYPKTKKEAKEQVTMLLDVIDKTRQRLKAKDLVNVLTGKYSAIIKSNRFDEQDFFGCGSDLDGHFWMSLIRQVMVNDYIRKDIETYGVMFLTDKGRAFLKEPHSFMMTEDHNFDEDPDEPAKNTVSALDDTLLKYLKDLRKKVAKEFGVPPFVVFQDTSLEDMCMKYPINITELTNVFGVGEGKAKKYGKEFVSLIAKYVEENDIIRPEDLIVKTTGANSALKLFIIQNVDKKLPLPDIAKAKGLSMDEFLKEMEQIVYSGTKLNINYWIDEILDEEQQEELHDYFLDAETDKISVASKEFGGDYEDDELRLYRIKFISEVGN